MMYEKERQALLFLKKHGLNPIKHPLGDDHHTDAAFTKEDEEIAELAFYLGGLFCDVQNGEYLETPFKDSYFYTKMTSIDCWKRIARALRVHGLKIVNK